MDKKKGITMKTNIIILIILSIYTNAFNAYRNVNPDKHGDPWILSDFSQESRYSPNYKKFSINESIKNRELPLTCDNSTKPQFPPIFLQKESTCAQVSSIGYHFTYEKNLLLGTEATTDKNVCSYMFTYSHVYDKNGSFTYEGYEIAKRLGCPSIEDFKINDDKSIWMDGYEKYYRASNCLVDEIVSFNQKDIKLI